MLSAITAAILGGTSLRGGEGAIVGTMFGALLLTVLQDGTVLLNVSGYWERVIIGSVVLVAVLVDSTQAEMRGARGPLSRRCE